MKVGVVTSVYAPGESSRFPGINRYSVALTTELSKRGVYVRIFTPSQAEAGVSQPVLAEHSRIEVVRVPDLQRRLGRIALIAEANVVAFGSRFRRLRPLLEDLDTVQTDLPLVGMDRLPVPVIGFVHHIDRIRQIKDVSTVPFGNALAKIALPAARHVIVPSEMTAKEVGRVFGVNRSKISVINHGVDLSFFRPAGKSIERLQPKAEFTLLSVSRLERRKRVDELIKSFRLVRRTVPRTHLLIVGSGPELHRLQLLARQLGVENEISFTGEVGDDELLGVYQRSDVFMFTSDLEGFGFVLAEAMACGKPVVASDSSVTREVVADAGRLVPAGAIDRFAGEVTWFLTNPERMNEFSRRARERAESLFDWKRVIDEYLRVYRGVGA